MVWARLPQQFTRKKKVTKNIKQWAEGYKKFFKKTVTVLLFKRLLHVLSLGEDKKMNHEEKKKWKSFNSSHILKIGAEQRWGANWRQYSSCSSCWSSAASLWVCWFASCPSPSATSPPSCWKTRRGNGGMNRLITAPLEYAKGQTHVTAQRLSSLSVSTAQYIPHDFDTKEKKNKAPKSPLCCTADL